MGEGCRWGRREWEWGLGEHRLLVHARHSSGVVSIACSVITSLWKHAQSHTLLASWKAATRGKLLGRCQRQMGLHPDLHLGLLWAAVVIYLFIFSEEWVSKMCRRIADTVYFMHAVAATEAEPGRVRVRQLDLCSDPSSLKDMGRLGNDCSQADLGTWT